MFIRRLSLISGLACLALLISLDWMIPTPLFYSPFYPVGPPSLSTATLTPFILKRNIELCLTPIVVCVSFFAAISERHSAREKYCAYGAIGVVIGFWLRPRF
jgi:hypothetical protein